MLFAETNAKDKRIAFSKALSSGKLQALPGAFSPLVAMLIEEIGFDGVYISGAVLANDLGLPDVGLTSLSEVAGRAQAISRVTKLPAIVDADTGFGEVMNVTRTIHTLEEAGLAGCHIEDQENPKRCGHLDNKTLVSTEAMVSKIRAAAKAKRDKNFVLIARTDARAGEGLDKAIERAKAYVDAGADAIFPEALQDEKEFENFRKAIKQPLLANMTEFGKSKLLSRDTLANLGYNIVIYPVTSLRLAMKAVEDGLKSIKDKGTQEHLLNQMQTRKDLYKLLNYEKYQQLDQDVFNFKI